MGIFDSMYNSINNTYYGTPNTSGQIHWYPGSYQTDSTGGLSGSYQITPSVGTPVYIPMEQDSLKSKPETEGEHEHAIQCVLRLDKFSVVAEYKCHHCDTVLFSKVICKIPKSIRKQKCLAKIVKGV